MADIPYAPIRLELRYSIMAMPVGTEVISNYVVEATDERRQFRAVAESQVSFGDAERKLLTTNALAVLIEKLRIQHT